MYISAVKDLVPYIEVEVVDKFESRRREFTMTSWYHVSLLYFKVR